MPRRPSVGGAPPPSGALVDASFGGSTARVSADPSTHIFFFDRGSVAGPLVVVVTWSRCGPVRLSLSAMGSVLLIFPFHYGPAAFGLIFCAPLQLYHSTLPWAWGFDSASLVPLLRCFGWHNFPLSYIGHLPPWLIATSFFKSAMAKQVSLPQVGSLYDAWMELSDSICRGQLPSWDLAPATIHPVFSAGSFNTLWTNWIDREFRDDVGFRNLLIQARVFDAICLARKGRFFADSEAMGFLLQRWNKSTHTFIAAFGEILVTLEDVVEATLLPFLGDLDPRLFQLDADE
ncbi:hypothetical protein COLO4_13757 [Corchorus olitorius]|uniref:Aminotransferase-like plant mobile domain-containing protein n=1 Tax=Corchorus olitorius TaxID=93759 RepID=A0A1R3JVL5_9ROSI|nr:hypothetical protein COLO4_13757 [Corchorus olitorius]